MSILRSLLLIMCTATMVSFGQQQLPTTKDEWRQHFIQSQPLIYSAASAFPERHEAQIYLKDIDSCAEYIATNGHHPVLICNGAVIISKENFDKLYKETVQTPQGEVDYALGIPYKHFVQEDGKINPYIVFACNYDICIKLVEFADELQNNTLIAQNITPLEHDLMHMIFDSSEEDEAVALYSFLKHPENPHAAAFMRALHRLGILRILLPYACIEALTQGIMNSKTALYHILFGKECRENIAEYQSYSLEQLAALMNTTYAELKSAAVELHKKYAIEPHA